MATIRKRNQGYEAQVRRHGHKAITKSFRTKSDAQKWARHIEDQMVRSIFVDYSLAERLTVKDVLRKYADEILPTKKSCKQEKTRVNVLISILGHITLARLSTVDLSQYRDHRLQSVGPQTVIHELGLLNRSLKAAMLDWGVQLPQGIPQVRKPKNSRGRDRRVEPHELKVLLEYADSIITPIILFAIETALRRGEIEKLRVVDVNLQRQTLKVWDTKNGEDRVVPLSSRAVNIVKKLPNQVDGALFGIRGHSISRRFRQACSAAGIEDLRFHDLRHEAISRLFELGLNPMEVSSISGHKTLQMLKRYTHLKAEDLVKKLG